MALKKWMLLCTICFLLSACQLVPGKQVIIEWVDVIQWDGQQYEAVYEMVLADRSFIDREIGEVSFKVADNVTDTSYKFKDGDAAFHEKGTKLYAIKGLEDAIAIEDLSVINGYRIYIMREDPPNRWLFEQVPLEKVQKIEFYTFSNEKGNQKTASYTDQSDLDEIQIILANSQLAPSFEPNVSNGDTIRYDVLLYTDEAIAFQYGIQFDGATYFWFPFEKAILPNDIQPFLLND
ncbi:hypothetical protein ACULLL_08180 [Lysinibacillus irui]|uniref:hypothetical protein n=1 Tax=Lysinibacillus irui TaxID=2998077 RepID=UPI004044C202